MAKTEPFERHTKQYEDWFEKNKWVYQSELKAISEYIPKTKKGIEIGVGSGQFGAPLGIKIGIEPSRNMGMLAQQRGIKVIQAVAENLPLKNSSFDFALMVTTICFLDNVTAAFKEVFRIIKPHGFFIMGFVDKNSPLGQIYQERKAQSAFYKIATFYSTEEVIFYIRQAGFKDLVFSQTIFKNFAEIKKTETNIKGYGRGSFVVIKAIK